MIHFAEVALGSGGTAGCTRCAPRAAAVPRALGPISDDIRRIATRWTDGPGPNAVLLGMEPFSHPELPRVVHAAQVAGFSRIRLQTDAGALADPGNAAGAIAAGVRQIEVVVLGGAAEHDALTGRPGLFRAAEAGVRAFIAEAEGRGVRIAVTGRVPLCRHTLSSAAAAVAALAAWGAVAVVLDGPDLGAAARHEIEAALHTAAVNGIAASVVGQRVEILPGASAVPWHSEGVAP